MKAKIKVNLSSADKKVLRHIFLMGKIKNYSEIEGCNMRVNTSVKKFLKAGLLVEDKEGYKDLNIGKYPILAQIKTVFRNEMQRREYNLDSKTKEEISKNLKFTNNFLTELLENMLKFGFDPKKLR